MQADRGRKGIPTGEQLKARVNPESSIVLPGDPSPKAGSWPHIDFEERQFDDEVDLGSRRQRASAKGPYRAAIVPEMATIASIDIPSDEAALAPEALVEIAGFDAEMGAEPSGARAATSEG